MLDTQGAAGILSKSSEERKSGEAFPQSRLVSQTKQSHLTWCIDSQTRALARLIFKINIRKRLAAVVAEGEARGLLLDRPGRRESAGHRSFISEVSEASVFS